MRYRAEIDGLRALSVAGVVIFHADFSWQGHRLLSGGYLGVDVFFAISGYLLTGILLREIDRGDFSLWNFYVRRVRRIIPALYLVLASSALAAYIVLPPEPLVDFAKSGFSAIFFYSNVYFWLSLDYFAETSDLSALIHIWSLSVEEQFYFVYPVLLLAICRSVPLKTVPTIVTIAGVSLLVSLIYQGTKPAGVFHLMYFRAWELLAGALIACGYHAKIGLPRWSGMSTLGSGLILLAFVLGSPEGLVGHLYMLIAVGGACLIIAATEDAERHHHVLASKPLVTIGLISYSLYLWHQPVFALWRHYSLNALPTSTKIGLIAITALLAWLTWRLVERPFRSREFISKRTLLWSWGAGTAVLIAVFGSMLLSEGMPWRYTSEQRAMLAVSAERGTLSLKGQACQTASLERVCRIGAQDVAPSWALLGDSHAETLSDALSRFLEARGLSAEVLTYPGCPFVLGVEPVGSKEACLTFTAEVLERIKSEGFDAVVINDRVTAYMLGSRFDNGEGGIEPGEPFPVRVAGQADVSEASRAAGVKAALKSTIQTLIDHGLSVIYVAPVPEVGWHVPHAVVKLTANGGLPLTTSLDVYLQRHAQTLDVLRSFEGNPAFRAVYPQEIFCSKANGRCLTHTTDRLLYTDTDHLSREGAALLVEHVAKKVQGWDRVNTSKAVGTSR